MKSLIQKGALLLIASIMLTASRANIIYFHPFYISVTEINYSAKNKAIEISCKMFSEDIQDILKQNYKVSVDFESNKLEAQNNKLISDYLIKRLAVSIDSKVAALKFVGFEKENESVYCYFEITDVHAVNKIKVINSILQDFKQEQINIIHVIVNGNRKSTKLDYPAREANFSF